MLFRNQGLSREYLSKRTVSSQPPAADSFFFRVFELNKTTAEGVLNTAYLTAMQKGTLPPDNYGQLMVLDSYYCYRGADTYNTALCTIDKVADPELHAIMFDLHESYRDYNKTFFDYWHIRTSESVNPTSEFIAYSDHEHHIACSQHPIYTLIAMLPCYYLWYWFSDQMITKGISPDNLYKAWIEGCHSAGSAYEIGNFIEDWKKSGKTFDEKLAIEIYTKSMDCELAVFTKALVASTKTMIRGR